MSTSPTWHDGVALSSGALGSLRASGSLLHAVHLLQDQGHAIPRRSSWPAPDVQSSQPASRSLLRCALRALYLCETTFLEPVD